MEKTKGRRMHLTMRAVGIGAAIIAASTLVSADVQKTVLLGLPELVPDIEFAGSVGYDNGGSLTIAGNAMFSKDKNGVPLAIIVISGVSPIAPRPFSDTDPRLFCEQSPADPNTSSLFVAKDLDGAFKCFHDSGWAPLQFSAGVLPVDPLLYATPPKFSNVPPSPDACGLQNGDNLCIRGTVLTCDDPPPGGDIHLCTGQDGAHPVGNQWTLVTDSGVADADPNPPVLVTGKVSNNLRPEVLAATHSYVSQFNFDLLEMVAQITGGAFANEYPPISASDSRQAVTMQILLVPNSNSSDLWWNWTKNFQQQINQVSPTHMYATDGSNPDAGFNPPDKCNASIVGSILNAITLAGIADSKVIVSSVDLANNIQGDAAADGSFTISGLCANTPGNSYTIRAVTPLGYTDAASDGYPDSLPVVVTSDLLGNDTASPNKVQFRFYPAISADFLTFGQGQWGALPNARSRNAGYLLQTYYIVPYGTGSVVIGNAANLKTVTMTGPTPVQNFLPQNGRPMPLDGSYVDPVWLRGQRKPHTKLGSLAGETLALRLNVDFSASGLTRVGLGSLHVAFGPLKGMTVNDVLTLGNSVLGGGPLPAGLKYDDVEDTEERINKNFMGGINRGYVVP
jgi:hypothetical protein